MSSPTPPRPLHEHPSLAPAYAIGSSNATAADLSQGAIGPEPLDAKHGRYFLDSYGRRLLLHGCNVSGINKLPTKPNGLTHLDMGEAWFDGENVSFVGRPWPLEESCVSCEVLLLKERSPTLTNDTRPQTDTSTFHDCATGA
jgi:hypothetical protein